MKKLLTEAEKKYPKGTAVKSLGTGLIARSSGSAFVNYVGDICVRLDGISSKIGAIRVYGKKNGVWAKCSNEK